MPRTPAKFTQADMRRAIAANDAAGGKGIVEVMPNGTIRVIPAHLIDLMPQNENKGAMPFDIYDENRPVM